MRTKEDRMCVACRGRCNKYTMIRIVKEQEKIFIDKTNKANGRGAYICNNIECIKKAKKIQALNRAFKCQIGKEIYDKLGANDE